MRSAIQGDWFWDSTKVRPEIYDHLPFWPALTRLVRRRKAFETVFVQGIPSNPDHIYAAYDRVFELNPTPAGIIGFLDASPMNLTVEIAVVSSPRYQRIHLTSNMIGLVLQYCLELPETEGWDCDACNGRRTSRTRHRSRRP